MVISVEEMKNYLRVDYDDDDKLIEHLISSAQKLCMDILRTNDLEDLDKAENIKTAVLYSVAYMYEHREEADYHTLTLTLRAMLFGSRKECF